VPDPNILTLLKDQAALRRDADSVVNDHVHELEPGEIDPQYQPGGIPDPQYRSRAMVTYAYSVRTQNRYVGYSGTAGGMTENQALADHDMAWRRWDRIQGVIGEGAGHHGRSSYNCGEAAAFSIAVAWQEELRDLVFASFNTTGGVVDPCQNCQVWLAQSYGYYLHDGSFRE
jgi:hypothetical protein